MAVLTVGRVFDGIDVYPVEYSWSGDALSVAGYVDTSGLANPADVLSAARDRLAALSTAGPTENVVPVTYSEDASLDGYYRVGSAQIGFPTHTQVTYGAPFQLELQRFGGGAVPQCEVYGTHAARVNSHSITTSTLNGSTDYRRIGVPAAATDFWSGAQSTAVTRTTSTGALSMWYLGNYPQANTATYTVEPGDFYDGACELRTTYGAAASQLVTGLYCPPAFDGMVLSNGLVRAFLHPSIGTAFELEVFDGSQWENLISGVGWRIEHDYGGGSTHSWDLSTATVQILENTPVRVTIRLVLAEAATVAQFGRVWLDLTVRRGDVFVSGVVRSDTMGSLSGVVALEPTTATISTALTGGIRASTTDLPEANRAVWGIANGSPSNNLTTGRIVQTSGQTITPFMVGFELGGSSSSGIENAQDVLYQWYDTKSESLRVVRR